MKDIEMKVGRYYLINLKILIPSMRNSMKFKDGEIIICKVTKGRAGVVSPGDVLEFEVFDNGERLRSVERLNPRGQDGRFYGYFWYNLEFVGYPKSKTFNTLYDKLANI